MNLNRHGNAVPAPPGVVQAQFEGVPVYGVTGCLWYRRDLVEERIKLMDRAPEAVVVLDALRGQDTETSLPHPKRSRVAGEPAAGTAEKRELKELRAGT